MALVRTSAISALELNEANFLITKKTGCFIVSDSVNGFGKALKMPSLAYIISSRLAAEMYIPANDER